MALDTTPFQKALNSLQRAVDRSQASPRDEELRDACIQRFEYTFEIGIRMLRRQLKTMETPEQLDLLSYKELIRLGAERGLIDDPEAWFRFREKRNLTVHTYDETKARDVHAVIPDFLMRATTLLERLQARRD